MRGLQDDEDGRPPDQRPGWLPDPRLDCPVMAPCR